jgi:hypothetical protein
VIPVLRDLRVQRDSVAVQEGRAPLEPLVVPVKAVNRASKVLPVLQEIQGQSGLRATLVTLAFKEQREIPVSWVSDKFE